MSASAAYYDYTWQEHVLSRFRLLVSIKVHSPATVNGKSPCRFRDRGRTFFSCRCCLFFLLPNLLTFGWNCETCLSWYRIQNYLSFRHIEILLCDVNENVAYVYVDACERVPHVYVRVSSPPRNTLRMRFASARYTYRLCAAFRTIERRGLSSMCQSRRDEEKSDSARAVTDLGAARRRGKRETRARNCVIIMKTLLLENAHRCHS